MYLLAAKDPINHVTDKVVWWIGDTPVLTMHMVTLVVATGVFVLAMMAAARAIRTGPESEGNDRYITKGRFAQMIEAIIVYLRTEMLEPVLGAEHTRRYLPYLMTVFFFVLFQNLFGLIPILDSVHLVAALLPPDAQGHERHLPDILGGTATANIAVTGALAFLSFILIEIHGFRELGVKGWLEHQTGGLINEHWSIWPVMLIVVPVELVGHIIKPAALAIRLFANMVAGHTLMAVLLGFGAAAVSGGMSFVGWGSISLISGIAAVLITFLELFVAFLQAFIFMFLTAVFLSLLSHHDDHEHEQEHEHSEPVAEPA